jgi:predicted  nucleic acid-binding Zn-ribbon protein
MNRLDALWNLQALDLDLDDTNKKLLQVTGQLKESDELVQARQMAEEAAATLRVTQRQLREEELELKGVASKIAVAEDRLYGGRVTNPKELGSLQQEQQHLKQRQSELEDVILQAMTDGDAQESALKERSQTLERMEKSWKEEQAVLSQRIAELKGKTESLMSKRNEIVGALDMESVQSYEELRRKKGGRALGSLRGDLCLACRESNPTSKVQLAKRRSELVFCGGCGRILYTGQV